MDGYHLSRAQLSAMTDPAHAYARRGAEFTFDGESFLKLVQCVRAQKQDSPTLYAPSFDHAVKDPKDDDIPIYGSTRIIVFEGNYLSLNKSPWREAAQVMDESWFVNVDFEVARQRLIERHVRTGVEDTPEGAERRTRENDLINGEEIVKNRIEGIHEVVMSKEDRAWEPQAQSM
jgi:pantothenate kinase